MRRLVRLLVDALHKDTPPPRNAFKLGDEAFGCDWPATSPRHLGIPCVGVPEVIGYRGEWYVPVRPTPRVRLLNLLVSLLDRWPVR